MGCGGVGRKVSGLNDFRLADPCAQHQRPGSRTRVVQVPGSARMACMCFLFFLEVADIVGPLSSELSEDRSPPDPWNDAE